MKKWIGIQIIVILLVAFVGQICKVQFPDRGLMELSNIDDTYKIECGIEYYFGDNELTDDTEKELYENFLTYEEDYVKDSDLAPIVIIGRATGGITNYTNSLGQEIFVEKVLKGTGISEGNYYYVYGSENFLIDANGNTVYTGLKNPMKPNDSYLIFLEASILNELSQSHTYSLKGSFFSYLNLEKNGTYLISDPLTEVKYLDLMDTEFFVGSVRVLNQMNHIKSKIIEKFIDS